MRVLFSTVVAAASGRIGGMVFSRNGSGPFVKTLALPRRQPTSTQSGARALWNSVAHSWRDTLATTDKTAWDAYALTIAFQNPFGQQDIVNGYAAFMRTNILLARNFQPLQELPPGAPGHGQPVVLFSTFWSATVVSNEIQFQEAAFTNWSRTTDNDALYLYISPQYSPGTNVPPGTFSRLGIITGNTATPPIFPLNFPYPRGTLQTGNKVFLRIVRLSPDGAVSKSIFDDKTF